MPRNKIILIVGDVLIPFLGFYFWNWNLYFVFLFMFLDLLSYLALYIFKFRKIVHYKNEQLNLKKLAVQLTFFASLTTLFFIGYTLLFNTIQQTEFKQEIIHFFLYKDMGFAQGYILLPLVILTSWSTYKADFLMIGKFTRLSKHDLFKSYLIDLASCSLLLFLFYGLYSLHVTNQKTYFYSGILLFLLYKLLSTYKVKHPS